MPRRSFSSLSPAAATVAVGAAALAVKGLFLLFDRGVLLHSDSGAYVMGSFVLGPMWPRPVGYSLFLRAVWELLGGVDLAGLVVVQSAVGALVAAALFRLGEARLGLSRGAAAAVALVAAASPLALVMERYLLADALAVAALVAALIGFFAYLDRPGPARALAFGALAVAPYLVRSVWIFLPVLLLALAALRLRPRRREALTLALAAAVAVAGWAGHGAWRARFNTGTVEVPADGSGFTGWLVWATTAKFARPGDLDGVAGGEILLADPADLRERTGDGQIWDFASSAHRLRLEACGGSFYEANRLLLAAGLRLAARHPWAVAGELARAFGRWFTPGAGSYDTSTAIELAPEVGPQLARWAAIDLDSLPRQPSRLGPAHRAGYWSRPPLSAALAVALGLGLAAPRRRFALLAVGAVGIAYLGVVSVALPFNFVERYYLPAETLGLAALALLLARLPAALGRRPPPPRLPAPSPGR